MEKHDHLDLKLAIIGIGANNTEIEVNTFRQGFDIRFPLFADKDMTIYRKLEGAGTPTFIAARKEGDRRVIFFRKAGGFNDPREFFENVLQESGLP
jgi:hypothetical protein